MGPTPHVLPDLVAMGVHTAPGLESYEHGDPTDVGVLETWRWARKSLIRSSEGCIGVIQN